MTEPTVPAGTRPSRDAVTPAVPARRRHRRSLVIAGATALLVGALLVWWLAQPQGADDVGLDRTNPESVAVTFLQRYAVHDPKVCDLVTAQLHSTLDRAGRCSGPIMGDAPTLTVLNTQTCGSKHGLSAELSQPGELGKRYATVSLERTADAWSVAALLPVEDRAVIRPYACQGG